MVGISDGWEMSQGVAHCIRGLIRAFAIAGALLFLSALLPASHLRGRRHRANWNTTCNHGIHRGLLMAFSG